MVFRPFRGRQVRRSEISGRLAGEVWYDVHVLGHEAWTQAAWNATRFPYSQSILFHFHGLRLGPPGLLDFGSVYPLPPIVFRQVYGPYVADLTAALAGLPSAGCDPRPGSDLRRAGNECVSPCGSRWSPLT